MENQKNQKILLEEKHVQTFINAGKAKIVLDNMQANIQAKGNTIQQSKENVIQTNKEHK